MRSFYFIILACLYLSSCESRPEESSSYADGLHLDAEPPMIYGKFQNGFKWGVSTASYQIEGGWNQDGKGESNWDVFTRNRTNIKDGSDGKVACDSYNKVDEDIKLLKQLGVSVYRFSISWARVLPDGTTKNINKKGIDYYKGLITKLKAAGIEPMVTLFHWDLPQALQARGGWLNADIANWFTDYARVCFKELGDNVKLWNTLNEPIVTSTAGYGTGEKAPGIKGDGTKNYIAGHNQLRAHAAVYRMYQKEFKAKQNGKFGLPNSSNQLNSPDNKPENIAAAHRATMFRLGWFSEPLYTGNYPQIMIDIIGNRSKAAGLKESRLPKFTEEEKKQLKGSADFFALNLYTAQLIVPKEYPVADQRLEADIGVHAYQHSSWLRGGSDWLAVYPPGLRQHVNFIKNRYGNPPIYITENGVSDNFGGIDDLHRIYFYKHYLNELLKASLQDGVDVKGFIAWSLLDNFEWENGYTEKFGLVNVNFTSPDRTRKPKASFYYYKSLIEKNGFVKSNTPCTNGM